MNRPALCTGGYWLSRYTNSGGQTDEQKPAASCTIKALSTAAAKNAKIAARKFCILLFLEHKIRLTHVSEVDWAVPSFLLGSMKPQKVLRQT